MHSGVLFILFCIVTWLDVEGLNIEAGKLTISEVGAQPFPPAPVILTISYNLCVAW